MTGDPPELRRWMRKERVIVNVCMLLLCALVGAGVYSYVTRGVRKPDPSLGLRQPGE